MSNLVNMLDAKTSLSRLVQDLESGVAKEYVIARNGRPAARLVPLAPAAPDRLKRIGVARGRFAVPDDIDVANEDVRRLFEGEDAEV